MELTISTVILFQFIVVFCNGINPSTILKLGGSYDKTLRGHGYKLLKVKTLEHCHRICLYSPKCLSVNWNIKTKYCQLNSEDVGTGTPLMMSTGDLYVPALSSNIKNHACTSSPCKFGEVCIPVTSAAGSVCLVPDDQVSTRTTASTPSAMPATMFPTTRPTTKTTTTTTPITATKTSLTKIRTTTTTIPKTTIPTTAISTTTTTTPGTTTPITMMPSTALTATTTTPATTTPIRTMSTTTLTKTQRTTPVTTTTTKTPPTTTTTPKTTTTSTATTTPTTATPTTTPDCSTYSDSFTRIKGYVVWQLNNKTFTNVPISTCERYCVESTAFTCKSYEYYYAARWCYLQSIVKDDALSAWRVDFSSDYFERVRLCDLAAQSP